MTSEPTICFGQQPCGFFPKRFLVAKINTAKKLQAETGGRIVFFYHDSDADYRETITIMSDRQTGADLSAEALAKAEVRLNFTQENKLQKKFSPLYAKRVPAGWKEEILKQLPRFIDHSLSFSPSGGDAPKGPRGLNLIEIFKSVNQKLVADFCLEMYKKMGLLDGVEVVRSSDKNFRQKTIDLAGEYFADVEYQGEVVRAKVESSPTPTTSPASRVLLLKKEERLRPFSDVADNRGASPPSKGGVAASADGVVGVLHEGGDQFIRFPINQNIQKSQISAARDQRFAWMQSVINCSYYIYGEGERDYLDVSPFPKIKFIDREKIEQANYGWLGN
jgi:hypothetical protein